MDQAKIDRVYYAMVEALNKGKDWVDVYEEIFAAGGLIRLTLDAEERLELEEMSQYRDLLALLADRRRRGGHGAKHVITVRMPGAMHRTLIVEAAECLTTLNQLCVSKLLLPIPPELVSAPPGRLAIRLRGPSTEPSATIPMTPDRESEDPNFPNGGRPERENPDLP